VFDPIRGQADQLLQHARKQLDEFAGAPSYMVLRSDDEVMAINTLNNMESDLLGNLEYYSSWMAYLNSQVYEWQLVEDIIDRWVKDYIMNFIINPPSMRGGSGRPPSQAKLETLARTSHPALMMSLQIAQARHQKAVTELKTATTYRDLVSRMIAAQERMKAQRGGY